MDLVHDALEVARECGYASYTGSMDYCLDRRHPEDTRYVTLCSQGIKEEEGTPSAHYPLPEARTRYISSLRSYLVSRARRHVYWRTPPTIEPDGEAGFRIYSRLVAL